MNKLKELRARWRYRRAKNRMKNKNIAKASFLYYYFIVGGVAMFVYSLSCAITGLPLIYVLTPILLLFAYFLWMALMRNWKLLWLYVSDINRGRLLLRLNDYTHYSEEHKLRLLKWVYTGRRRVRNERILFLGDKVANGEKLTRSEKREIKRKVVTCPQQLLDGINKAILISVLIYAHEYIRVLDDDLRDLLELTDENMMKFNLSKEIDRCRVEERQEKISKYTKIGMEKLKNKTND